MPPDKDKKIKKVSIIIPVYNEKKSIGKIITRVNKAKYLGLKREIIVIDDGSRDGTSEIIKSIVKPKIIKVFHKKK